jgi:hypothetical protein
LPRRPVPTLAARLHVLVDHSAGMQPFALDVETLCTDLVRLVGADRVRIGWFRGCPTAGIAADSGSAARGYPPMESGEVVLCVTDFGLGGAVAGEPVPDLADWTNFAARLRGNKCPLTILTPYPAARLPWRTAAPMRIVVWDRTTRAGDLTRWRLRRAAAAGQQVARVRPSSSAAGDPLLASLSKDALSLAECTSLSPRIEPQLMREMRLRLRPRPTADGEADLFWNRIVDVRARTGLVLRSAARKALQARLQAMPDRLDLA